jgi:hypothetical protein
VDSVALALSSSTWSAIAHAFALPIGFQDYLALHASAATEFALNETRQEMLC